MKKLGKIFEKNKKNKFEIFSNGAIFVMLLCEKQRWKWDHLCAKVKGYKPPRKQLLHG